jgi:hypothetical protein
MYDLIMVTGSSLLNRLRGKDIAGDYQRKHKGKFAPRWMFIADKITSKYYVALYMGWLVGLSPDAADHNLWVVFFSSFVISLGYSLWAGPGWGDYFSAYDGLYKKGPEIKWIDWVGYKLFPLVNEENNRARGTIQMSLRGLYMAPCFVGLALLQGWGWESLLLVFTTLMQGPAYGVMKFVSEKHDRGAYAEYLLGAWWGLVFAIII